MEFAKNFLRHKLGYRTLEVGSFVEAKSHIGGPILSYWTKDQWQDAKKAEEFMDADRYPCNFINGEGKVGPIEEIELCFRSHNESLLVGHVPQGCRAHGVV